MSDLYAPVSGTLVEVNAALESTPEVLNDDPYTKGWMVLLELEAGASLDALMTAEQYDAYLGSL